MDIKLKDLFKCIRTYQIVKVTDIKTGESFYPNYGDITNYGEYYVSEIQSDNDKLIIHINEMI